MSRTVMKKCLWGFIKNALKTISVLTLNRKPGNWWTAIIYYDESNSSTEGFHIAHQAYIAQRVPDH